MEKEEAVKLETRAVLYADLGSLNLIHSLTCSNKEQSSQFLPWSCRLSSQVSNEKSVKLLDDAYGGAEPVVPEPVVPESVVPEPVVPEHVVPEHVVTETVVPEPVVP